MNFGKFSTISTTPSVSSKSPKPEQDNPPSNGATPKKQRPQNKRTVAEPPAGSTLGGITATNPITALVTNSKVLRPKGRKPIYVRMLQGIITLILVIDKEIEAANVNRGEKNTVVVYPTNDAINKYRSENTKNSTLTGYNALDAKCKDVVDSILALALANQDWSHISLNVSGNDFVSLSIDGPSITDDYYVSESGEDVVETPALENSVSDVTKVRANTMTTRLVQNKVKPGQFPCHRRQGVSRPFGELGTVMLFKEVLSNYPPIEPGSAFVVVEGDETHEDWGTMQSKALLWMLKRWLTHDTRESYLQNLQAIFDIGLYDDDLSQQWFCHIDNNDNLIIWTAF